MRRAASVLAWMRLSPPLATTHMPSVTRPSQLSTFAAPSCIECGVSVSEINARSMGVSSAPAHATNWADSNSTVEANMSACSRRAHRLIVGAIVLLYSAPASYGMVQYDLCKTGQHYDPDVLKTTLTVDTFTVRHHLTEHSIIHWACYALRRKFLRRPPTQPTTGSLSITTRPT